MNRSLCFILLISLFSQARLSGQNQRYIVSNAPFSSRINDEFSPVYYKGGIVYCSNQASGSLVSYQDENKKLSKIFYLQGREGILLKYPKLLAKELTSGFNDGPVTFNDSGNVIYYSRNNSIENSLRNINDTTNKLGIYSAELVGGTWSDIRPFAWNDPRYTFSTPSLSPDGKRLYFSSDFPGGSGGMDLYYCDFRNNGWEKPVNLGPLINTSKSESFPFAASYGILYFASDGLKGFGGKDLFYTRQINGEWITPVHLDSAINSTADDFGLVTDSTLKNGYFSTNRLRTDDIFSFGAAPEEFENCKMLEENNFCFTFYDEKYQMIDTIPVIYEWDFGNGVKRSGTEVRHCFPGPGDYIVRLTIVDQLTGDDIAGKVAYSVHLENKNQPFITSYNVGLKEKPVLFDASESNLSGFTITDYFWDTGNGFVPGGQKFSMAFRKQGEHTVRLGLLGETDSLGIIPRACVLKKIRIYDSFQEIPLKIIKEEAKAGKPDDRGIGELMTTRVKVYLMDDLNSKQKSGIREILKGPFDIALNFNPSGITGDSYLFLDVIAEVLKKNLDISVEIVAHSFRDKVAADKEKISRQWARLLDFYYKNKGIDDNTYSSNGSVLTGSVFDEDLSENKNVDGVIEFVFMKK